VIGWVRRVPRGGQRPAADVAATRPVSVNAPADAPAAPTDAPADAGGLGWDLALYLGSALFALFTAAGSTLAPHRAWGRIAVYGYALATLAVLVQLLRLRLLQRRAGAAALLVRGPARAARRRERAAGMPGRAAGRRERAAGVPARVAGVPGRAAVTALAWFATTVVPLVVEATQRAGGRPDRAQEEVLVVEHAGQRLLDTGTPYLSRAAIAALPPDERLLGYLPYQPGMALFGVPRAVFGVAWWTDARVWFGLVTAAALGVALLALRRAGAGPSALVRAAQGATVLPLCALTLATGGDDLPVLALCLLGLALAARAAAGGRGTAGWTGAGLAVGTAGALKLFAWPVALVLVVYAAAHARRPGSPERGPNRRAGFAFGLPALGLPVLVLLPALAVDPGAAGENVLRFPLGRGLVGSPAQSPLPGHLIAAWLPGGRMIAAALLVAAGLAIAVALWRQPPRDAGDAARICAYGLTAAIMLLPSTRFGYLLYPVAYLLASPALRVPGSAGSRPAAPRRTQGG